MPYAAPGQAIGLLGGSFDPPHAGHVHITREALKRFGLNRIWWLVSPGNPLKPHGPAPLARRLAQSHALMQHPRVEVTDIETRLGTRATADTIAALRHAYPRVHFVWLMGADNLAQLHRWQDWRRIMRAVPVAVLARPGDRMAALRSPAARVFARWRLPDNASHLLARSEPPAWCFMNVPMTRLSSTQIRRAKGGM